MVEELWTDVRLLLLKFLLTLGFVSWVAFCHFGICWLGVRSEYH